MLSGCLARSLSHIRIERSYTLLLVPLCHLRIFFYAVVLFSTVAFFFCFFFLRSERVSIDKIIGASISTVRATVLETSALT